IIDDFMIPNLKNGDYYEACSAALRETKSALLDFSPDSFNASNQLFSLQTKTAAIPAYNYLLWISIISFLVYGLGLLLPWPGPIPPLAIYPACWSLSFILVHLLHPVWLNILVFFIISLGLPILMVYGFTKRYVHQEEVAISYNIFAFLMELFNVFGLMVLGFIYTVMDTIPLVYFAGVVICLFASQVIFMTTDLVDMEGEMGTSYSSGTSHSSGGSSSSYGGSSSSSEGYSSGGGSGGYSGGGGSFGGGGASGDW
ncbi:MAG: TPM domain-containing protein, partial [Bacteroidota bacterium]